MAEYDPISIARSGIDPVTKSPLSADVRKALFRRTVSPASVFGRGGALVKRGDPTAIVSAQSQQLSSFQEQLNVIRAEVTVLNTGINGIAESIRQESALEQQRLLGEQQQEQRLTEQKIRVGQESELERKIKSAIAAPVIQLQRKVSDIFSRIGSALTTLFFGWLTNQGIETLKALESGDRSKLEEIKDVVLKNVAYAIGTVAAVKFGFGLVIAAVKGIAGRILRLTLGLALAPLRFAGRQLSKLPLVGRFFGGGRVSTPRGRPPVTGGNLMTRFGNFFRGSGGATRGATAAAARGGGRIAGGFTPGLGTFLGGLSTAYDLSQGDLPGASLSALSMFPVIGGFAAAGRVGLEVSRMGGEGQQQDQQASEQSQPQPAPAVEPQVSMMPQASELSLSPGAREEIPSMEGDTEYQNIISSVSQQFSSDGTVISAIPSSQIQTTTRSIPSVGPLPEPEPNVIMMPSAPAASQNPPMVPSSSGTDVPLINSANPDNFYVLYSQLNYNVVM